MQGNNLGTDKLKVFILKNGLIMVANKFSEITKRKITKEEVLSLKSMIENMPVTEFKNHDENSISTYLANLFINKPKSSESWKKTYQVEDIRDYQKKELNNLSNSENQMKFTLHADRRGQSLPEKYNVDPLTSVMPLIDKLLIESDIDKDKNSFLQSVLIKSSYRSNELINKFIGTETINNSLERVTNSLINFDNIALPRRTVSLDSRNKLEGKDLKWELVPFTAGGGIGQELIYDTLQQIIEISCSPFYLPIPVNNKNILFYKKIKLSIEEFNTQAIVTSINESSQKRIFYIFDCDVEILDNFLYCKPTNIWKPSKPINQCTSLTLNFYSSEKIIFDVDRTSCTITNTNPAIITTQQNHNLSTSDLVYFSQSGNYLLDQENGYYVTVLSLNTFSVPLDLTLFTNLSAKVFFASKKIALDLTFISLEH